MPGSDSLFAEALPALPGGVLLAAIAVLAPCNALAYGAEGHLVAGRAAEPLLCSSAAAAVERLVPGDDLGEVGLWADRIRTVDTYLDSGPWHYMNIDDDAQLDNYEHPPEGDLLEAIERFTGVLSDSSASDAARTEALRFLVHFIADIHQPLHVGRADDRGGNRVTIRFAGEATNLHRFWDTHAIEWAMDQADQSLGAYTASVEQEAKLFLSMSSLDDPASLEPALWAEESLSYRDRVYDFGLEYAEPSRDYLDFAAELTRTRLALAGARIAGTLNSIYCGPQD